MSNAFRVIILSALIGAVLLAITACHRNDEKVQAAREPVHSQSDKTFIAQAEEDNIQERAVGRFIMDKSRNKDIKNYADTLVKDHADALQRLGEIMNKYGIKQPTPAPDDRPEAAAQFKGLSGRALDLTFVNLMVEDHEKAIATFQQEARSAEDSIVRQYASNFLPTLESHLKRAQELQTQMARPRRK